MKNITIAGNIGKDAEVRTTQKGDTVTGWSVAVSEGWGDNKRTIWFDCSWWGVRGEKVASYIRKGERITVAGELSTREHEGRTYLTLRVNDVTLQGGDGSGASSGGAPRGGYEGRGDQQGPGAGGGFGGGGLDESEIPFAPEWR